MKRTIIFAGLLLCAALVASPVAAQQHATADLSLLIQSFARVSADTEVFQFLLDPAGEAVEAGGSVRYETNDLNRTVKVHVEGDLSGIEVQVAPVAASLNVLGMAQSGSTGAAAPATFRSEGSQPLVTGIRGAGAVLGLVYRVVPLEAGAAEARNLRIYYTIN